MLSKKIKTILLFSVISIFIFSIDVATTNHKTKENNQRFSKEKSGFIEFTKGVREDIYANFAKKDLEIKLESSQKIPKIVDRLVNFGYKVPPASRSIDTIIIHSSYNALGRDPYSVEGVIYEYRIYGVSPHYLIDRNGTIFRLVKDEYIAYHAGKGRMPDGRTNINSFSIGIELINTKNDRPNENQYSSLVKLVKFLKSKYQIKYILGHNEISPQRKTDPWNFNWQKFNELLNK
jgi:N-acetyl-anhydromuramyl-L-alanine amidase AmpD